MVVASNPRRKSTTRRRRKGTRPALTAEQARSFDGGIRTSGLVGVMLAMGERAESDPERWKACQCEPYADVFTFARWKAQGLSVRKGERAMRHSSFVRTPDHEDEDGTIVPGRLMPTATYLFCRCQVETTKLSKRQQREQEIAERKARLAELQYTREALKDARPYRPAWATGWTDENVIEFAANVGKNPYEPDWFAGEDCQEIGQYRSLSKQGSARQQLAREAADIRAEIKYLEVAS